MKNIQHKKIAIIGGGPGGLTLARLLQMNGADVKVYERDAHKDAREKGATLDLHQESGLLALKTAGLMDAFNATYRPGADMLKIMDKTGAIIYDDADNPNSDRSRPEIDRGPLQQILLDSLQPDTVIWNSRFVALQPKEQAWEIKFENGVPATADLVIAADGANSKLRPYITPIKPFYAGLTIIEGSVYTPATTNPQIHTLLNNGKIFAMDDSKSFIISAKGDGSLVFYAAIKADEIWAKQCGINLNDKTQVSNWFKTEFVGWSKLYLDLFDKAKTPFTLRQITCMPLTQTWQAQPNLTMLGDAAHVMPPFSGEGVNMAMLDALELSDCLLSDGFETTHAAIAEYEKHMRERISEEARQALEATEIFHSPRGREVFVDMLTQPHAGEKP